MASWSGCHVVEQDRVDAGRQRLFELIQRIDLDLDLHEMADAAARGEDRRPDAAGHGDVVVLDQHAIVEAEAVVHAAAHADGVFLHGAQSRHGLARAADARLVAAHRLDQRGRAAGDAAEMAEEVQRDPLGGQHAARRTGNGRDAVAGREHRAVRPFHLDLDRRIDQPEGGCRCSQVPPRRRAGARPARFSPRAVGGTIASVVRSPARPRSSRRAARTTGSTMSREGRDHRHGLRFPACVRRRGGPAGPSRDRSSLRVASSRACGGSSAG